MTELAESTDVGEMIEPMTVDSIDQRELAERLLEQAKEQNIELVGPDVNDRWNSPGAVSRHRCEF